MREIKFRGLTIDTRRWVYGLLTKNSKGQYIVSNECTFNFVDPETIGEFTGLKDRCGKEIFEGDIIENESKEKLLIVWVEDICAFYQSMIPWSRITTTQVKNLIPHMVDMRFNHKEVIGNIYENPELLQTIS